MDEGRKSVFAKLLSAARASLVRRGFLRDDSSDDDEGDAHVGAPIRPRPHLNSGAVALEEPDETEY